MKPKRLPISGDNYPAYAASGKGFHLLFPLRLSPSGRRTHAATQGLYQAVETHVLENPKQRLPAGEFKRRFGVDKTTVGKIARHCAVHHGLGTRPAGGVPPAQLGGLGRIYPLIEKFYASARRKSRVSVYALVKRIARETGFAISVQSITKKLAELEKKNQKGLNIDTAGLVQARHYLNVDDIVQKLAKGG